MNNIWNSSSYTKIEKEIKSFISEKKEKLAKIKHDYEMLHTPLTFEAINDEVYVYFIKGYFAETPDISIEYSTDDGQTWNEWWATEGDSEYFAYLEHAGDKVLIRGYNDAYGFYDSEDYYDIVQKASFYAEGSCYVYGNIMSLIDGDNFYNLKSVTDYAFTCLFCDYDWEYRPNWLYSKDGFELLLPATNLGNNCYAHMLCGSSITTAPDLPAKQLSDYCYAAMFQECERLKNPPKIKATILADSCFSGMFSYCISMISTPEINSQYVADDSFNHMFSDCKSIKTATNIHISNLSNYCCAYMFSGCENLIEVFELPYTELYEGCYIYMFSDCTNLITAPSLPATILKNYCYRGMFYGCTSLRTAPELPAVNLAYWCYAGMFQNCTNLVNAPNLPATTLNECCYSSMFNGCISLTVAPKLLATTSAYGCYSSMFSGCTSLTTIFNLPAVNLAAECYYSMFNGCSSLITAPELPATALARACYQNMFTNCINLTNAPELPATTLANNCYSNMFEGCKSLITAPVLSAPTLVYRCYYYMFGRCNKLNYVKCLATNISASNCTWGWLSGVTSKGVFIKNSSTNWSTGTSGIPTNWLSGSDTNIGDESNTNFYFPTYAYYKYSITQQIYTSEEIGQEKTIKAIGFKVSNLKSATRDIDIYIQHTNKNNFDEQKDWVIIDSEETSFSGQVTFLSEGWTYITLDTPFQYNGNNNLLICVCDNSGECVSSQTKSPKFYSHETESYKAIRFCSDVNNYNTTTVADVAGTLVKSNNDISLIWDSI